MRLTDVEVGFYVLCLKQQGKAVAHPRYQLRSRKLQYGLKAGVIAGFFRFWCPILSEFHRQISHDLRRGIAVCYVALERDAGHIAGYSALSARDVVPGSVSEEDATCSGQIEHRLSQRIGGDTVAAISINRPGLMAPGISTVAAIVRIDYFRGVFSCTDSCVVQHRISMEA